MNNEEVKKNDVSRETIEENEVQSLSVEQIEKLLNDNFSKYDELLNEYFTKKSEIVEEPKPLEIENLPFTISNDALFLGVAMFAIALVFLINGIIKGWLRL